MRALFFDTETTSLWNFKQGVGHPSQPDLVQLAAILIDTETRLEHNVLSLIVTPEKPVDEKAAEVHGITPELIAQFGVSRRYAVAAFDGLLRNADVSVAHNFAFDQRVMEHAYVMAAVTTRPHNDSFCTMHATTNICKLPHPNGRAGHKWPKLIEAYSILVDPAGFDGAHDALVDVRADIALYFKLREMGITPCARVAA